MAGNDRKFGPDLPLMERVALLEAALEVSLNRGSLEVGPDSAGDMMLWIPGADPTDWVGISLYAIARDIERHLA